MADMKPEDDDVFDDADFEDLDPIEGGADLEDDSWEDEDKTDASDSQEDETEDSESSTKKQKTFVQKNFSLIVGLVVVVFGGIIGVSMLGGGTAQQATPAGADSALPEVPAPTENPDTAGMPPMPAPIDTEESQQAATPPSSPGELTPMPTPGDSGNTELANLEVEEVPALPAGNAVKEGQAPFDFAPPTDETKTEEKPEEPSQESNTFAVLADDTEAKLDSTPAVEGTVDMAPPSSEAAQDAEKLRETIKSLEAKLAERDAEIKQSRDELDAKGEQLSQLEKTSKGLEEKIAALRAQKKDASSAQPVVTKEPSSQKKAEKETVVAQEETASAPSNQPAPPSSRWILKSAQSGKAMLSSVSTGDTRDVQIGDTVQGLGKITFIDKENGRWTVRGTKGSVVR